MIIYNYVSLGWHDNMEYSGTSHHTRGEKRTFFDWHTDQKDTKQGTREAHKTMPSEITHAHTHTWKMCRINKYIYICMSRFLQKKSVDESHDVRGMCMTNQQKREPQKEEKKRKETGLFQTCNSKPSILYNNKTDPSSLSPEKKKTKIGEMLRK